MRRRRFLSTSLMGACGIMVKPFSRHAKCKSDNPAISGNDPGLADDLTLVTNITKLNAIGYENVLYFGADPTGISDSTNAIQAAIDAGYINQRAVLFPEGTYIISNTLRCYKWWESGTPFPRLNHMLTGESVNGKRPLIKLASAASLFDSVSAPKPLIAMALFRGDGTAPVPPSSELNSINPINGIPGFIVSPNDLFDEQLIGIDFDCNNHAGAVGVYFPAAQKSVIFNVKIIANSSHTGLMGVPGRNSGGANIEIIGGRTGVSIQSSAAGTTLAGLKLSGQTERAIVFNDFVPAVIVGFEIRSSTSPVISAISGGGSAWKTFALIDGTIEVGDGGLILDNKVGKAVYIRNVFAKGSSSFIASGSQADITGSGEWYRISEYCYTDQKIPPNLPPKVGDNSFLMHSLLNGALGKTPQPVVSVMNNSEPPADLISKHLPGILPQFTFRDPLQTINIMDAPYNAVPDSRDNWSSIQQAIDDGNSSGKMVFIPKGTFFISKTLFLKSGTRLTGIGCKRYGPVPITNISAHSTWQKTTGNEALIGTVDDPEASTFISGFNLVTNANVIRHMHWRAGRKSMITGIGFYGTVSEAAVYLSGNGGGKQYMLEPQSPSTGSEHRHIRISGTFQPLSIYGCNLEADPASAYNMEITDSSNIRIYGIKREKESPTVLIRNCKNLAIHTLGAMREGVNTGSGGYIQIKGASDGILLSLALVQSNNIVPNGEPTLSEAINGLSPVAITWPEGVSIYKRGEIDDSKMDSAQLPPAAVSKNSADEIKVYPSITDGMIYFENGETIAQIRLLDSNGRILKEWDSANKIYVGNYSRGIYLLKITTHHGFISTHKIVRS